MSQLMVMIADVKFSVPQESVLGPLLFLAIYNDLNQNIKFCKDHHFADDTNLYSYVILVNLSIDLLNMLTMIQKNLTCWLNAKKFSECEKKLS